MPRHPSKMLFSRWATKKKASRGEDSSATISSTNAVVPGDDDNHKQQQQQQQYSRLSQENAILRQGLTEALERIRHLECRLATAYIDFDDDSSSVEVMSVDQLSTTSSTTTLPTGSPLANQARDRQQQRDDRETLKLAERAAGPRQQQRQRRTLEMPSLLDYRDPSASGLPVRSLSSHGHLLNDILAKEEGNPTTITLRREDSDSGSSVFDGISFSNSKSSHHQTRQHRRTNDKPVTVFLRYFDQREDNHSDEEEKSSKGPRFQV